MDLTSDTITILKNFSTINPSILIKEGTNLQTISPSKTIVAEATCDTEFGQRFAIYNLSRFLSAISLFDNPTLAFSATAVAVSDTSGKTMNYTLSEEANILTVEKSIKFPSSDVIVVIKRDDLANLTKALGVLGLPEIAITGDGSKVIIRAVNVKDPTSDVYAIEVGETDQTFNAIFRAENLKILPGDYTVSISNKKISQWDSMTAVGNNLIRYYIAVEKDSTFA